MRIFFNRRNLIQISIPARKKQDFHPFGKTHDI